MPKLPDSEIVIRAMDRAEAADVERSLMQNVFTAMSHYVRPSRDTVVAGTSSVTSSSASTDKFTRLFDTTLVQATIDHAAGIKSWMSPASSLWFKLDPPDYLSGDDEVESWLAKVTQKMHTILAQSNFHDEEHEALLDGSAFGIRSLFVQKGKTKPLLFTTWEPGSFSICENDEGKIDTVFVNKAFTARQAEQKFGRDMLPPKVLAKLTGTDAKKVEDKDEYLLCIYPREDAERDGWKLDAQNMPVASLWIHKQSKTIVEKSGFQEMPSINSRYMKWGNTPFGLPPALLSLADGRQLNVLQRDLDLLAEIAANPRLLLPAGMEGIVNLKPGGPTFYSDPQMLPRTWGTEGANYTIGMDRVNMRRESIKMAFHLNAFKAFADITKRMTATETMAVQQEAIDQFSPTFTRMGAEHYEPILQRCFNILLRASMEAYQLNMPHLAYFPLPPQKMMRPVGNGQATLDSPLVTFTSRIALALRQIHTRAFDSSMQRRLVVAQAGLGVGAFDDLDMPHALRSIDLQAGMPQDFFVPPEQAAQKAAAREQAAQQQQHMQMVQQAADAAGKVKGTELERKLTSAAPAA